MRDSGEARWRAGASPQGRRGTGSPTAREDRSCFAANRGGQDLAAMEAYRQQALAKERRWLEKDRRTHERRAAMLEERIEQLEQDLEAEEDRRLAQR